MDGSTSLLAVIVLCVLAGCSGIGGQEGPAVEETVTPAPVPTVAADSTTEISEHGIQARAIVADHEAALENRSYTTRTRFRWEYENGSTLVDEITHKVDSVDQQYSLVVTYDQSRGQNDTARHELWSDGDSTLRRDENAVGHERYRREEFDLALQYPRTRILYDLFSVLEAGEITKKADGNTLVRGRLGDVDRIWDLPQLHSVENATMSARITAEGYVERAAIGFNTTRRGEAVDARITIEFTDVGSTDVSEPGWVENATSRLGTPTRDE